MAKNRRNQQSSKRQQSEDDFGLDEVDAFHAAREKVLLDEAGPVRQRDVDEESDEEVMGVSEDESSNDSADDDDDAEFFGKKDEDEEVDEDGAWGSTKGAYYGADDLEDEETAKQIEEEALRQQKRHLEELNMDDYVDEELEEEWKKSAKKHDFGSVATDKPQETFQNILQLDSKSKLKYLSTSHPEYIPLSKELTKLKPTLDDLKKRKDQSEVLNVKFTALSAYLGAISSYFALFISLLKEDETFTMKEHPVMESILSSKEVWRQANELDEIEDTVSDEEIDSRDALEQSEDESLQEGSDEDVFDSASESIDGQGEEDEERSDIEIDISKPRTFKKAKPQVQEDFAEGEIDDVDAEEKKSRKRTLRFYTSKIDQQAKKKDERYTGDLDIPYKERLFERQQRLIEEARKRGQHDDNGADLDDDFDSQDEQDAREVNDAFDDSYYNTIKSAKVGEKLQRKQVHEQAVKAAKEGKLAELQEHLGDDGKRAVNYQILKNKGLTPHRNKDNRNSRVKKRKKYEKAKKKLSSTRAVFSQPTGAYEGEKTGIKKNLSKSVKF